MITLHIIVSILWLTAVAGAIIPSFGIWLYIKIFPIIEPVRDYFLPKVSKPN
jgi:hypothetical protein